MKGTIRALAAAMLLLLSSILVAVPASGTTATLSGSVSSSKGSIPRGKVQLFSSCQDFTNRNPAGVAAINGGYYTVSVPAGIYLARIEPSGYHHAATSWHSATMDCASATPVNVTGNTTVDLIAVSRVTISGSVKTSDGPVTTGRVTFYADCNSPIISAEDTNLSDGYSAELAPGTYRVKINNGDIISWHGAANTCQQATDVVAAADATLELVGKPTRTFSGTVRSANGPVTTATLAVYLSCDQVVENIWAASAVITMSGGTFTAKLAAGSYVVRIDPAGGQGALSSWHAGMSTCQDATPVSITDDNPVELLALPDNNVSGTVRTAKGPVAKGGLAFVTTCEPTPVRHYIPVEEGKFRGTVPDGTYRVLISNYAAGDSWHSASATCAAATPVSISGLTTLNMVGLGAQQRVARPPKTIKRGTKVKLARTTDRGAKVTWSATTPTCRVRAKTLLGRKAGLCRVKASAPAAAIGIKPLSVVFKVKVR